MGKQLTVQYKLAVEGYRNMVILGAMLDALEQQIVRDSEFFPNSEKTSLKGGRPQGGVNKWLRTYAPEIPFQRAYEFLKIAQGIKQAFQLAEHASLAELLQAEQKTLQHWPEEMKRKRNQIVEAIEGKSARQLLLNFGGIVEVKKKADTVPLESPPVTLEILMAQVRTDTVSTFKHLMELVEKEYAYQTLDDVELDNAVHFCQATLDTLTKWRKTPKKERSNQALKDHLSKLTAPIKK